MQFPDTFRKLRSNIGIGLLVISGLLFINVVITNAQVNKKKPDKLQDTGVEEKLGNTIPGDITFTNADGKQVSLKTLFKGDKPVIINPVYYECPMLCSLVLNGLLEGMKELAWSPGKDYKVITFSIDPQEGIELARKNKTNYLTNLNKKNAEEGWYFLTGDSLSIHRLANAIGFRFKYVPEKDQYAHAAAIAFVSPNRKITRYLYGIDYNEIDLKNALYESANGNIGNTLDKIVMYCYQYDPSSNSYTPMAWNVMKLGGLATLTFLGIFLGLFWYNDRRKNSPITTG